MVSDNLEQILDNRGIRKEPFQITDPKVIAVDEAVWSFISREIRSDVFKEKFPDYLHINSEYPSMSEIQTVLKQIWPFHNHGEHTMNPYKGALAMSDLYVRSISDNPKDIQSAQISAIMHDVGMIKGLTLGHEAGSVEVGLYLLTHELEEFNMSEKEAYNMLLPIMDTETTYKPDEVSGYIVQVEPKTYVGKALQDADVDNFGRFDFHTKGDLLYAELKKPETEMERFKWYDFQSKMLLEHKWNTDLAKNLRSKQQKENLIDVRELRNDLWQYNPEISAKYSKE